MHAKHVVERPLRAGGPYPEAVVVRGTHPQESTFSRLVRLPSSVLFMMHRGHIAPRAPFLAPFFQLPFQGAGR